MEIAILAAPMGRSSTTGRMMRIGTFAITALVGVLFLTLQTIVAQAEDKRYPEAKRIVTIGGSLTEIVYALGGENRLAGRDSTSVWPEASQSLPDVGYMRALSPEGVLSIKPDLIVALEGSGPPEAVAVLKSAGVPFVEVPESFDTDGIVTKIGRVGIALGMEDKAKALEEKVRADLVAAQEAAKVRDTGRKVLFILSMQGGRILASGYGTAADGIIAMAGAHNAVTEFPGYKQLNDEAVINAAPDLILMMDRGGDHSIAADQLFTHPAVALTPAAKSRRLVRMDGAFLLGFGPRTAEAIRALAGEIGGAGSATPISATQ